jgi:AraC-like DNA-binding protein
MVAPHFGHTTMLTSTFQSSSQKQTLGGLPTARDDYADFRKITQKNRAQLWQQRLSAVLHRHLADPDFDIDQLAQQLSLTRSTLLRRCKLLLDNTPSDCLREFRLQQAHRLLTQGFGQVTEIALAVGYDSLSSFTRAFKTHFGMTPRQVSPNRRHVRQVSPNRRHGQQVSPNRRHGGHAREQFFSEQDSAATSAPN